MNADLANKFLGVRPPIDPITLLGLSPARLTTVEIDGALRRSIGRVFDHPDGRTPEADELRKMLRQAAAALKDPASRQRAISEYQARPAVPTYTLESSESIAEPGEAQSTNGISEEWIDSAVGPQRVLMPSSPSRRLRPTRAATRLTDFDRHVLALLVASGGWNANCRARLVSMASARNVSVEGLLKVLHGLSDYAKSGGPRLSTEDITEGERMNGDPVAPYVRVRDEPALIDRLVDRVRPNFDDDDPSITIKFAVFFGAVTVLVGVLLMRTLINDAPKEAPVVFDAPADPIRSGSDQRSSDRPVAPAVPEIRPARFTTRPTFLGTGMPVAATNAADEAANLADQLDDVERRISVSDDPAEAVYRNWETTINAIGTGWVLMDQSTIRLLNRRVDAVLVAAADRADVPDRLLRALTVAAGPVREPLDIWRDAWRIFTAARLATHPDMPALIRERARALLEVGLAANLQQQLSPEQAAHRWLDRVTGELIAATSFDDAIYDKWELWLSALRAVSIGPEFDSSITNVIGAVLRRPDDLGTEGPLTNLLGRMLEMMDDRSNPVARDALGALFDDPAVSSHDLWILTSLLATFDTTPWFTASLMLPHDADTRHRGRIRDRILRAWPRISGDSQTEVVQGRGVVVDPSDGARWMSLNDQLLEQRMPVGDSDLMFRLLAWSRLNEAASLLAAQDTLSAGLVMARLENYLADDDVSSAAGNSGSVRSIGGLGSNSRGSGRAAPPRGGQPIGPPGVWAAAYEDARSNTDAKLALLRQLQSGAGTDLHQPDAAVVVREMYRGQSPEIRMMARQLCIGAFARGVNVAQEMLDQLPDAQVNADLSDVIGTMTNHLLPPVRSADWPREARLALIDHVLWLRSSPDLQVDELVDAIRESYSARMQSIRGATVGLRMPGTAQDAARLLADAYLSHAAKIIANVQVPDSITGLESRRAMRLRLAQGPIQSFVAEQLTVLDLLAYIAAAEQPVQAALMRDILNEALERRRSEAHVIRQAVEGERAIATVWRHRLEISASPGPRGGTP